jgi:ATP-dependent protease ClpP protease subunit
MAELYIYDEIGPDFWGLVSARSIISQLDKIPDDDEIVVRINSPGGDVNEGIAIYNALSRRSQTRCEIDALAASAASYIAMACDTICIAENAMLMIHNPYTIAMGNADELRQTADILDKYGDNIATTYATRCGKDLDEIKQLMNVETWFTAQEAVDAGLADEVGKTLKVAAKLRDGMFRNAPTILVSEHEERKPFDMQYVRRLERQLALLNVTYPTS